MPDPSSTASSPPSPPTMSCFHLTSYGKTRDLLLKTTTPTPSITKPTQVLLRVYAASINQGDCKLIGGDIQMVVRKQLPFIPGFDVAGVVIAIGSSCSRLAVGDAVYGNISLQGGSWAEYVVAEENLLARKPRNMSFNQAATIAVAAQPAYQAIHSYAKIKEGDKILILGGSGGVGSFAIQMAVAGGAIVTATASTRNQELLKQLGATTTIDYTQQSFDQVLSAQSYDVVFDCVGGNQHYERSKQVLKKGGHFIALTFDNPDAPATLLPILTQMSLVISRKFASFFGSISYSLIMTTNNAQALEPITTLMEQGKIKPIIEHVYPFTQDGGREMCERAFSHRTAGKLVLQIVDEVISSSSTSTSTSTSHENETKQP